MATAPPKGLPLRITLLELVVRLQSYGFRHRDVLRLVPRLVDENHVVLRGACRNTRFRNDR
jgi:hypothetical protein